MKKHLFNFLIVASILVSSIAFNSCSEYTEGDPNSLTNGKGSIQIKILSGIEKGKTYTNSGLGTVVGTKRMDANKKFVAYQILGTYQNMQFNGTVLNENGTSVFQENHINFTDVGTKILYTSSDDNNGSIKITDIQLLESYDKAGAQIMNGKLVFKGIFTKESIITLETVEDDVLIEGTITF